MCVTREVLHSRNKTHGAGFVTVSTDFDRPQIARSFDGEGVDRFFVEHNGAKTT